MTKIILIKGDITKFSKADAIVNAGNETLCGCFTPGHQCLDNQIHRKAGPLLHEECKKIMNGKIANPADVIITSGYDLPSKYIIHAYGPNCNVYGKQPDLLAETYDNCLSLLEKSKLKSIAFPSISTGLYGYPKSEAAEIAVKSVKKWLKNHLNHIDQVFFIAYEDEDEKAYKRILSN